LWLKITKHLTLISKFKSGISVLGGMEEGALFGFALSMQNAKSLLAISFHLKRCLLRHPAPIGVQETRLGLILQAALYVRIKSATSCLWCGFVDCMILIRPLNPKIWMAFWKSSYLLAEKYWPNSQSAYICPYISLIHCFIKYEKNKTMDQRNIRANICWLWIWPIFFGQ